MNDKTLYTERDTRASHKGMKLSERDWSAFIGHVNATLDAFRVPRAERSDILAFVESTKKDIVEPAAQVIPLPWIVVSARGGVSMRAIRHHRTRGFQERWTGA